MSLRTTFVAVRDRLLVLTDPTHFDIRPHKLTIRTRAWVGGAVGNEATTYVAVAGDTWASVATAFYRNAALGTDLRVANGVPAKQLVAAGTTYQLPAYLDRDLAIPPRYEVAHVSTREIAGSGGRYEDGDMKVRGISPAYYDAGGAQVGGFTPEQLKPEGAAGTEIVYVVTGPEGGEFQVVQTHFEDPFSYDLVIRNTRRTP